MHFPSILLAAGLLASSAVAHPGPHPVIGRSELHKRNAMAKRCAPAVAAMNEKRYNKRSLANKRSLESRANATVQITTEAPYYEVIQNDTCILTPEVTQGKQVKLFSPRNMLIDFKRTICLAAIPDSQTGYD